MGAPRKTTSRSSRRASAPCRSCWRVRPSALASAFCCARERRAGPIARRWRSPRARPDGWRLPGDTMAILYTSGTTGPSKGVCCPQAQYFWWGVNSARLLGIRDGDVLLTPLPLFHTNALNALYQALLSGSTIVFVPRFSASGFFFSLCESKATVTYLLGAMVPILLSRPKQGEER